MQTLYSMDSSESVHETTALTTILKDKIHETRDLYTYLILFVTEVARYAEIDSHQKASKHLPSENDLNINTKISGNELLWKTIENPSFTKIVKDSKLAHLIDQDLIKKCYIKLIATEEYKEYTESLQRDSKSERKMLQFIFDDLLLPNEDFISHIEEHFINWDDDAEQMQIMVTNYFNKPKDHRFDKILSDEKWNFALDLVRTVLEKNELTMELIKPKLNNWDADRIASLDLIMLQMGICEFLFFETIPTKVTINEYIDLAKAYSTPQSGQFVNGLLDNIHKELMAAEKIFKKPFK
jgi:N utilization substance protein B